MSQRSGTLRRKEKELHRDNSATLIEAMENSEKNTLNHHKRQILTVLLEDNLCLSAFIASNTKISDTSQPSKSFMDIIHFACKERLEDFIFQLLEKKVQSHYSKIESVQDMKNVLRDNSLIMLMILQYIKENCEEYFKSVFGVVIEQMIPSLDLLQVDDGDKEGKERAEKIIQIEVNRIVNAVVSNVDNVPEPILRVCTVLRIKITAALTKMSEEDVEQDLQHSGLKRRESIKNSDGGLTDLLKEEAEEEIGDIGGPNIQRKASLARKTSVRKNFAAQSEIFEEPKSPEIKTEEEEESASFEERRQSTLRRTKVHGKNTHRKRSKAVANTIVDTILASFLFLRIFVPAITNPVQQHIISIEIPPNKMRGLIQIGRALVSMCNELDLAKSSDKPTTLARLSLNSENKAKIKEFVHEVSVSSKQDRDASASLFTLSQVSSIEDDKIPITEDFITFLLNSLPGLELIISENPDTSNAIRRLFEQLTSILNSYNNFKKSKTATLRRPSAIGDKAKGISVSYRRIHENILHNRTQWKW
eukprot:NODE_106_length_19060_cov_0.700227.p3 type:complete len:533 gc:universal NODE_106_length_19060_cov_0.700227:11907-10309(-)